MFTLTVTFTICEAFMVTGMSAVAVAPSLNEIGVLFAVKACVIGVPGVASLIGPGLVAKKLCVAMGDTGEAVIWGIGRLPGVGGALTTDQTATRLPPVTRPSVVP